MPKLLPPLAALAFLATISILQAQTANLASPDLQFAARAASGGHAEVELGHLALAKSNREDVRQFAQRMVDDHTRANRDLSELAMREHIRLPRAPEGQDAAEIRRMSALSGANFDRPYIDLMVKDHRQDVADFEREARSGQFAPLRTLANATLPMLREHLHMAEALQANYGEEKAQMPSYPPHSGPSMQ